MLLHFNNHGNGQGTAVLYSAPLMGRRSKRNTAEKYGFLQSLADTNGRVGFRGEANQSIYLHIITNHEEASSIFLSCAPTLDSEMGASREGANRGPRRADLARWGGQPGSPASGLGSLAARPLPAIYSFDTPYAATLRPVPLRSSNRFGR